jgi:hypothetical protein
MLYLLGTLQNVFSTPGGVSKSDGRPYPPAVRLQVLATEKLDTGEERIALHTLSADVNDEQLYRKNVGKVFWFPVRSFKDNLYLNGQGMPIDDGTFPCLPDPQ